MAPSPQDSHFPGMYQRISTFSRSRPDEAMPFLHEHPLDYHLNLFSTSSEDLPVQSALSNDDTHRESQSSFNLPLSFDATWPPSAPQLDTTQSLLFSSGISFEDEQTFAPSSLVPYHPDYPIGQSSYPLSQPARTPEIRLDTSNIDRTPSSHLSAYPPTPFDQSPSSLYGCQNMTPSESSRGSLPPRTPSVSPSGFQAGPYFLNHSPTSPSSPSFPNAFDMQQPYLLTPKRPAGQAVVDIAAAYATPHDGYFVPQRTYRPHTQSDRRRYVEEVDLEEPIMFLMQNPTVCGISVRDALNSRFMNLRGRDDLMFINNGPSVSIRLMWPGYAPWSRQIPTRDFRSPPGPITRAKLAKNVAKTVQRFIEEMQKQRMEDDADVRWRVGNTGIKLDDLVLVGLQHVSKGSWQAYVRLRGRA